MIGKEAEESHAIMDERFKQQVFASAFGAFDPQAALKQYYEIFEKKTPAPEDYQVEEFEPQSEGDVLEMLNAARRAGVIT